MTFEGEVFRGFGGDVGRFSGHDLTQVGGIYGGNNRATEFLCLTLKMLQIAPERGLSEFIKNEDHKYEIVRGVLFKTGWELGGGVQIFRTSVERLQKSSQTREKWGV